MNTEINYEHPRDAIMATMSRIYRYRMTTTSGGNLSIKDAEGNIWISPARIDKGRLRSEDIICVRQDGSAAGPHPPSSELPFHQAIYAARPDISAIIHAHPVALVAFSISRQVPNTRLFHQAHSVCGKVGFAPYACPGSQQLGQKIADTFQQNCDSVIMENHGVVVGAATLPSAFERFEALEFAGKTQLKASRLGEIQFLTDSELALASSRAILEQTFTPETPSTLECELRKELCEFLRRGCRQRLLISTEGSFSARIDQTSFLVTPTQKDRELLQPRDLVRIQGGECEFGKRPSRATRAHQAIYERHPDIGAIVFAHPVNATAFSITSAHLDTRTIPESYVFLRDVQRTAYGMQFQDVQTLAQSVGSSTPATLLSNDGVLVAGKTILDTFDRLEVLESTAEALINAHSLGSLSAMPPSVIEELIREFDL